MAPARGQVARRIRGPCPTTEGLFYRSSFAPRLFTVTSLLRLPLLSISSLSSLLPAGRGKNSLVLINTLFGHLAVISLRVFRQALLRWPLLECYTDTRRVLHYNKEVLK